MNSVKKWGGVPEDYLPIHDMMDSSKAHVADMRHRMVFHSSFGIFVMEKIFGTFITNSDGKKVQVRDVAEQHCLEDLGCIPTLQDYLEETPLQPWMTGARKVKLEDFVLVD
jgi:hypothetical protein